ncbi:winged helix-turn-helix domain-containing protein [Streptomyces coelicoflavus]|uniref:ArsR/SmtB family transcription factor n=1 Tax=Streptomyces coelicoflavus TaxID=285562 RepID=UPI002E256402
MAKKVEPAFQEWRKQLDVRLGTSATLSEILRTLSRAADLTWLLAPIESAPARSRLRAMTLGWSEGRAAMEEFTKLSIMPYWQSMLAYLAEQREARLRACLNGGGNLLDYLHPDIKLNGQVLEVQGGDDREIESDGNGLLVAPSIFLGDRPAVLLRHVAGTNGRPVLVFSAQLTPTASRALWGSPAKDGEALGALMGRTRAQLLRLTQTGGTTSELARRVGTSAAAVSQHTSVLRRAGLIQSERHHNTVNHRITALGSAVLDGISLAAETLTVPELRQVGAGAHRSPRAGLRWAESSWPAAAS